MLQSNKDGVYHYNIKHIIRKMCDLLKWLLWMKPIIILTCKQEWKCPLHKRQYFEIKKYLYWKKNLTKIYFSHWLTSLKTDSS